MPEAVVVLRVLRVGERTDCLLEEVGRALVVQPLRANDYGAIAITIALRGPEAWEEVRDALDRAGADWREWLYLQFVVEHKADYNIRVVNLSLESSQPQSYKTDPLDAAVEAAWLHGIVVVAASGNRGSSPDAVGYAPGNDPHAISVGAVDDQGTKAQKDDTIPAWTSHGTTQDGVIKPDVLAPGAHIVAPLAPGSTFAAMCPSCITDGEYIRAGGTSMAAPVVAGLVADLLEAHPDWTPNRVKAALTTTARPLPGPSLKAGEVVGEKAIGATKATGANTGLDLNTFVDAATGDIDYTRATWSRATWSTASDLLRATWSRATWSCDCSLTGDGTVDPTRATWSRATWSTSWTK